MSQNILIPLVDYINFYTGEFIQYIGEGIHTETHESIILTKNPKKEFIAVPKVIFETTSVHDASVILGTQKETIIINPTNHIKTNNDNYYYIIGKGVHCITQEPLLFCIDSEKSFFTYPYKEYKNLSNNIMIL